MKKISFSNISFVGRRSNNQDFSSAIEIKKNVFFFAVADGMGGAAGGQIASTLVIENAISVVKKYYSSSVSPNEIKSVIDEIFRTSQEVIAEKIKTRPDLSGMGTTLVCLLIDHDKYVWGSLGDSRIYRLGNTYIEQITKDHTYVQDFIDKHGAELSTNVLKRFSNYLLKAIDGGNDQPDIFPKTKDFEVFDEDTGFVLCSDGMITDKIDGNIDLIRNYFIGTRKLNVAAQNLIANAFYEGSTDNITALLVEYGRLKRKRLKLIKYKYPPREPDRKKKSKVKRKNDYYVYALISFLIVVIFGGLGYLNRSSIKNIFFENNNHLNVKQARSKPLEPPQKQIGEKQNKRIIKGSISKPNLPTSAKKTDNNKGGKKVQEKTKKSYKTQKNRNKDTVNSKHPIVEDTAHIQKTKQDSGKYYNNAGGTVVQSVKDTLQRLIKQPEKIIHDSSKILPSKSPNIQKQFPVGVISSDSSKIITSDTSKQPSDSLKKKLSK